MFALIFVLSAIASILTGEARVEGMLLSGVISGYFLWHTRNEFKNFRTIANGISYVGVLLFTFGIFPVITGYGTVGHGMGKTFTKVDRDHEIGFLILGLLLLGVGFTARGLIKNRLVEPGAAGNGDKPRRLS